jgi:hypothetical protein
MKREVVVCTQRPAGALALAEDSARAYRGTGTARET